MRFLSRLLAFVRALFSPQYWTFGTRVHAEWFATFAVRGQVTDMAGSGLSEARVFFVDTGLDDKRSRNPLRWTRHVGSGSANGDVDLSFDYHWGTLGASPPSVVSGRFEVRIERYGYQVSTTSFDIELLPRTGRVIEVDVGTVVLAGR